MSDIRERLAAMRAHLEGAERQVFTASELRTVIRADLPALLAVAEAAAEYMKVSGPGGQDMARTLGERHWRRELRAALDALGGER